MHNGRLTSVETQPGCHWVPACFRAQKVIPGSDVIWNSPELKIVDKSGVPIIVSAILVFRVIDAKKAAFDVSDYRRFVESQGTAALKQVCSTAPVLR